MLIFLLILKEEQTTDFFLTRKNEWHTFLPNHLFLNLAGMNKYNPKNQKGQLLLYISLFKLAISLSK